MKRLHAVILALASIGAVAACSKGGSASGGGPAVVAGATVGTVVEIAGKVTATRAGKSRDLATGAEVSGDDQIQTGADAKVTILLAHNNVRWSLGANKSGLVAESVAWNLPKTAGGAATSGEDMSAAGRHAERSSADTAESTTATAPAPAAATAVAPTAPSTPTTTTPAPAMRPPTPPPPPPPPPAPKGAKPKGDDDQFGAGGLGLTGTGPGGGGQGEGIGLGSIGTIGKGGGAPGGSTAGGGGGIGGGYRGPQNGQGTTDPAIVAKIRTTIQHAPAISACLPEGARAVLVVECIHGACHVTRAIASVDEDTSKCLIAKIATTKIDDASGTTTVVVVHPKP